VFSRILTRLKLNKAKMLEPKIPIVRYEHAAPGDLLHIDIKKLARIVKPGHGITGNPRDETRGAGWEFLYVAVDDHSRIAFTAMMPDEKASSSASFLAQAVAYFAPLSIGIRHVMTDNGPFSTPTASAILAGNFKSSTSAPASTPQEPTARRNASSRPPSENGPTPGSTKTPQKEMPASNRGYTNTTGIDHMLASIKGRLSAVLLLASMATTS